MASQTPKRCIKELKTTTAIQQTCDPVQFLRGLNSVDDNKNLSQEIVNIVQNELNVKISGDDIDKSHPIKK